jgi:hypothetical protein
MMIIKIIICIILKSLVVKLLLLRFVKKLIEIYRLKKYGVKTKGKILAVTEGFDVDDKKIYGCVVAYVNGQEKVSTFELKPFLRKQPFANDIVRVVDDNNMQYLRDELADYFIEYFLYLFMTVVFTIGIDLFILFHEKFKYSRH